MEVNALTEQSDITDERSERHKRLAQRKEYVLSVLMPVYNEKATILEIVRRVREVEIPKEVVLVDDGSTDGTRDILRNELEGKYPDVKVVFHPENRGKGAAIRTAIENATGDYLIVQDADLEYDPREYFTLLEPLLDGRADVVYGSRFLGGGAHRVHFFWHRLGNGFLTLLSNMLTNLNLTDMEVCYKVFKSEVIKSIPLRCNRFDFEPEITAKVARRKCRIYEVPISYSGRDYNEGKKIGWRDGVQAIWTILKYRFKD
ncbi:glycosyl transferase [Armatimonadota bacterium]|nr:glycosyl transferase [Armatimonadota bacterium]